LPIAAFQSSILEWSVSKWNRREITPIVKPNKDVDCTLLMIDDAADRDPWGKVDYE